MPKITLSAVLLLLRLIIGFLVKAVRLGYSIVDLVDDGVLNNSANRPEWYDHIVQAIGALEDVTSHLSNIEDNLIVNQ